MTAGHRMAPAKRNRSTWRPAWACLAATAAAAIGVLGLMGGAPAPSMAGPAAAAAAPAQPAAATGPVSPVIYPDQDIPLRFSHVQHLTLEGQALSCASCHKSAATSRSSLDNLIPGEDACTPCHDIDRGQPERRVAEGAPPARCDACHTGFDAQTGVVARVRIPSPNLKFSHARHVGGEGMRCTGCHTDLVARGVDLATRDELPAMATCLGCHDGERAPSRCVTCHLAGPGGIVQTGYASGTLQPSGSLYGAAHDLAFRTSHAAQAQNNTDYCGSCHRERFCVDCHNGAVKPMDFHGNDYVALHAIDARRGAFDCSACHRSQSFCTGCHSRSGVAADGRGSEFDSGVDGRGFHPPGWMELGGRGPNHHSMQAQRNIEQCAACHREEFCLACHSAQPGSMRINPHPAGFGRSRRCRALLARAGRMCLRCHIGIDEARCE